MDLTQAFRLSRASFALRFLTLAIALACATPLVAQPAEAPAKAKAESAAPPPAPAAANENLPKVDPPKYPNAQRKLDEWKAWLDRADATVRSRNVADATLSELRGQTGALQSGASELIEAMSPPLDAANARAAELAPDPKSSGEQPDSVKLERARLLAEIAVRQGIIQQAKLTNVRVQQLLDTISERRRDQFANSTLSRSEGLINPSFWISVAAVLPGAANRLVVLMTDWWQLLTSQLLRSALGFVVVAVALLAFLFSPWRRWQERWTTRSPEVASPTIQRKARSAAVITLTGLLFPGLSLLVLYQILAAVGVLPANVATIVRALFVGLVFTSFYVTLTRALLAPGRPSWRLLEIDDSAADQLPALAATIGLVMTFGLVLTAANLVTGSPLEIVAASDGLVAILLALLFMGALRALAANDRADDADAPAKPERQSAWRLLIPLGWIVSAVAALAPLAGYVALGRFIAHELIVISAVAMTFILLDHYLDAIIGGTFASNGHIERFLRRSAGLSYSAIRKLSVVLRACVQIALIGLAVFVVLATWGINSDDIASSVSSAFFSFSIGAFTISPSTIFGAILVLILGMMATRLVQRWLEERFLPETSLDSGVRSSIRTGVGYVGVIAAAAIALSYVGLNLQNIAIVAGALSVGIGFGLQSIINNFVSGLILLVERPIKVGDRIEVGTRMGVVKRINVRATEIVTYDNLSVIVPNAELISGQVVNWMHGSFSARLSVMVGTTYEADPDQVIEILLDIVKTHDRVLTNPGPFAILSNFGADALEFTVFFHVANIGVDAGVANEVRLQVLKRFRAAGIEIPFSQRDLHLRDLDRLEAIIRRALARPADETDGDKAGQDG